MSQQTVALLDSEDRRADCRDDQGSLFFRVEYVGTFNCESVFLGCGPASLAGTILRSIVQLWRRKNW